jgi:hypothetical protein
MTVGEEGGNNHINWPKLVGYEHTKTSTARLLVRQPKIVDETTYAPTNLPTASSSSVRVDNFCHHSQTQHEINEFWLKRLTRLNKLVV